MYIEYWEVEVKGDERVSVVVGGNAHPYGCSLP